MIILWTVSLSWLYALLSCCASIVSMDSHGYQTVVSGVLSSQITYESSMPFAPIIIFKLLSSSTTQRSHWFVVSSLNWNADVVSVFPAFFWSFLNLLRSGAASVASMKLSLVVSVSDDVSLLSLFLSLTQYFKAISLFCCTQVNMLLPSAASLLP